MIRLFQRLLILVVFVASACALPGQDPERWVFEGLVTEADPVLSPAMQSGWVLSGSFLLAPIQMEEDTYEPELRAGRLTGGITEAELTVDLYYQLQFEALQTPGLAGLDYQDNNQEENGRDLLGWFFPMVGGLKDTGWSSKWLQVWLTDPDGKMIRLLPLQISPNGVAWKTGWFRITFENETGETANVDGRIEVFSPVDQLEETGSDQWYGMAAELSGLLVQRDATILRLQSELDEVQLRLDGLRRMVDLLVGERTHLEEENALLREQAKLADPEVSTKLAELTAEKSLLEDEMRGLSERNSDLAEDLIASEKERNRLLAQLESIEMEEDSENLTTPPIGLPSEEVPSRPEPVAVGEVVIVEKPVVYEEPAGEALQEPPVVEIATDPPGVGEASSASPRVRRKGPRKFR